MHAHKHEVLSRMAPALRTRLQAAAVAHRVTVDDVVRAGLRRAGAPKPAVDAAARIEKETPGAFVVLDGWPESCAFCLDILRAAPEACAFCGAHGCAECVRGEGCPVCQAKAREALDKARAEAAARDNARVRLAKAGPRPGTKGEPRAA